LDARDGARLCNAIAHGACANDAYVLDAHVLHSFKVGEPKGMILTGLDRGLADSPIKPRQHVSSKTAA
jgi:hypothetical protein